MKSIVCGLIGGLLLVLSGCQSMLPVASGTYEVSGERVTGRESLKLRNLALLTSKVDKKDNLATPVAVESAALKRIAQQLKRSVARDLELRGPFQLESGSPQSVDVEFIRLDIPASTGATALVQFFDGLLLFTPVLIGFPLAFMGMEGDAVFTVIPENGGPSDDYFVRVDSSYPIGLYYNHGRTVGAVAEQLVSEFRQQWNERHGLVPKKPVRKTGRDW